MAAAETTVQANTSLGFHHVGLNLEGMSVTEKIGVEWKNERTRKRRGGNGEK